MQFRRLTYKEFYEKRTYPYLDEFHLKNKGESFADIFERVNKLILRVIEKHHDKNIILVSHGDPIMIYTFTKKGHKITNKDLIDGKDYIPKAGIFELKFENLELINVNFMNKINSRLTSRLIEFKKYY